MVSYFPQEINSTFNLPDYDGRVPLYNSLNNVGSVSDGGVPNITGWDAIAWNGVHAGIVNNQTKSAGWRKGAFVDITEITPENNGSVMGGAPNATYTTPRGIQFDASASNALFGASSVITPAHVTTLYCIKY